MITAVVCIAKDEDHYINEWIIYHLAIGFDKAFIYCNDWKFDNIFGSKVITVDWPGRSQQLAAYNDFVLNKSEGIDWALVIDCDEFFCLGKYKTVKDAFDDYSEFFSVAFNWKAFGSNGMSDVTNEDYSVIQRFTKSQVGFNDHVKVALQIPKFKAANCLDSIRFFNPHSINLAARYLTTINATKSAYINSAWNKTSEHNVIPNGTPYIAHFMTKSRTEFIERRSKVTADTNVVRNDINRLWNEFDKNEVDNFDILNAYVVNANEER